MTAMRVWSPLTLTGEFIFGVRVFNAFHQPIGKPLIGDGFTLALSATGDKELGIALLPEIAHLPMVLVQSVLDAW